MFRMTMTRWQLMSLLTTHGTATMTLPDGRTGCLNGIEREDGSGRSFNVTVNVNGRTVRVYVRTTD